MSQLGDLQNPLFLDGSEERILAKWNGLRYVEVFNDSSCSRVQNGEVLRLAEKYGQEELVNYCCMEMYARLSTANAADFVRCIASWGPHGQSDFSLQARKNGDIVVSSVAGGAKQLRLRLLPLRQHGRTCPEA